MSTVLSTIKQQISFTADWLISGDLINLPQGVITDLSIVTKSTNPVFLGRLSIVDGILTVSFEQNGGVCAYGEIRGDGTTQALNVEGPVISATVTTGSITTTPNTVYTSTADAGPYSSVSRAQVSPDLVTVIGNMEEGVTYLNIIQDEQSTVYTLTDDTELTVSNDLDLMYDDLEGTAIVSLSEENYANFIQLVSPLISEPLSVVSINNIKSPSGILSINIETDGSKLPVIASGNTVKIDGSSIMLCGTPEDLIDSKISKNLHVTGYKPLDDMYNANGNRDTVRAAEFTYGPNSDLQLTAIDPNIDCISVEGGGL